MSIYCRASLLKFVLNDSNEIFSLTSNAIKYFEKLFGFPYPFSKYDQIFCPEYSTGAMENAGAVTINDVYVFREDVPVA
jgi:aminopeptidase N